MRARDRSPDSVIFTLDSNFSLFSSTSASVDRCSFASDALDRDSLISDISFNLAGHERSNERHESSTSDPDRDKVTTVNHKNKRTRFEGEKANVNKEDTVGSVLDVEDNSGALDSARSSFSLSVKGSQNWRSRSELISKKQERRRPASLDLNNVVIASSPKLRTPKKEAILSRKLGMPSPGTPNYRHSSVGMTKGWSSERVPLHAGGTRHQANAAFLPFNYNGRTLPSKWEDAERWIFSPVSRDAGGKASAPPPQRRPKAKSGPLGPPGVAYYSLFSPALPVLDGGRSVGFMGSPPFSSGVEPAKGVNISSNHHGVNFPLQSEPHMGRSISVHGCSDMVAQSLLISQDEKIGDIKGAVADTAHVISRRDMATQMSPRGSNQSSPARPSLSASTVLVNSKVPAVHSPKSEVKDVEVDGKVTVTRWSKKHKSRNQWKISEIVDEFRKNSIDTQSSDWNTSEIAKSISKVKRQEAKITAWENLQKAKAEAAIRKLEMKLERKRSSSMDKIINKLRSAQKRAQEMRNSVLTNQANKGSKNSHKAKSFHKTRQLGVFSGCFCHAFKVS